MDASLQPESLVGLGDSWILTGFPEICFKSMPWEIQKETSMSQELGVPPCGKQVEVQKKKQGEGAHGCETIFIFSEIRL